MIHKFAMFFRNENIFTFLILTVKSCHVRVELGSNKKWRGF
jgi:hypothetical protein